MFMVCLARLKGSRSSLSGWSASLQASVYASLNAVMTTSMILIPMNGTTMPPAP